MKTVMNPPRRRVPPVVPSEHAEQSQLVTWASLLARAVPELGLMFAIPNGGARHRAVAGKLRAEGVKSGVPDLCLPVARQGAHALYLEMKRRHGGRLSVEQRWWAEQLAAQGCRVLRCDGAAEASVALLEYLGLEGRFRGL